MKMIHTLRMKHCLLAASIISATGLSSPTSVAAVLVEDHFLTGATPSAGQYSTASTINTQNPTVVGFTGAWTGVFGSADVVTPGLTFSNGSGTVGSSGGALRAETTGDRSAHSLSSAFTTTSGGTFYLGFLLKLSSNDSAGYRAFEMFSGGSADADRTLQLGQSNGDFGTTGFGMRINNNNALRLDLGTADLNTHLFVLKLNLSTTANSDSITVWRDPIDLNSEIGSSTATGTLSGFDFNFDRLALAAFISGGNIQTDEFRMADTWQDVTATAVPEPGSALLGGLGLLALLRRRR